MPQVDVNLLNEMYGMQMDDCFWTILFTPYMDIKSPHQGYSK